MAPAQDHGLAPKSVSLKNETGSATQILNGRALFSWQRPSKKKKKFDEEEAL
jgi:hypothetical protein